MFTASRTHQHQMHFDSWNYEVTNFHKNLPKGTIVVDTVRRSSGFRPYSSASWPRTGSTTILKIPTTYQVERYTPFLIKLTCYNQKRKSEAQSATATIFISQMYQNVRSQSTIYYLCIKQAYKFSSNISGKITGARMWTHFNSTLTACDVIKTPNSIRIWC